jgi:hypothetical protein
MQVNRMNTFSIQPINIPGQQHYAQSTFPQVIQCADTDASLPDTAQWVRKNAPRLLTEATRDGAMLLRGFPVSTAEDFDTIVAALELPNFPYHKSLSNAVRINRTERVFSANEAPPEVQIFFHHEMAQTPLFPRWIFFSCEIAAEQGGATPLCRSDVLLEKLEMQCPAFVKTCEQKGLRYTNVMPGDNDAKSGMGRSWKSTLGVEHQADAENRLRELNYKWEWLANNCLKATTPALPAVIKLNDGRRVFFNQLIAAFCGWKDSRNDPSKAICHGDGTPLDTDAVKIAIKLSEELAFDLNWQAGDVVIVDNMVTMHARRTFSGTRKVLASLASMESNDFKLHDQA